MKDDTDSSDSTWIVVKCEQLHLIWTASDLVLGRDHVSIAVSMASVTIANGQTHSMEE